MSSDVLTTNLLSPFVLAFALGIGARLLGSDLALPKDAQTTLSTYLLLAIGLHGGVALAKAPTWSVANPLAVTLLLGVVTPISAFLVLRSLGRFGSADAAGIAAHYGSVSAVTFVAAQQFVGALGLSVEGYMTTLLTVLEAPGIAVALVIGSIAVASERTAVASSRAMLQAGGGAAALMATRGAASATGLRVEASWVRAVGDVLRSKSMVLLAGGLAVGVLTGARGWASVEPFFDTKSAIFKGALTLFLLQLGVEAGARLSDLRRAGGFLIAFGTVVPLVHGCVGVLLGSAAGLSVGGSTVLGAMAASASYIAAPPAVRAALPDANPTYSLVAALGITFPFNLVIGIPLYHQVATAVAAR